MVTYCLGAMFSTPLGFALRVGVSFLSLAVQVEGSKPSSLRSSSVSRITLVVFSQNPIEPPKRTLEFPCVLSQSPSPLPQPSHVPLEPGVGNGAPKRF